MLTIKFYFLLENIHKTFPYRLIFFSQISFLLFESYQNLNHSDPTQSLFRYSYIFLNVTYELDFILKEVRITRKKKMLMQMWQERLEQ
jgi:hypothetical protein